MNSHIDLGCEFDENADDEIVEPSRNQWPSIRDTFGWGQDYLDRASGSGGSHPVANASAGLICDYVQLPPRDYLTYEVDAWEFDHRFPRFVLHELFFVRVRDRRIMASETVASMGIGTPVGLEVARQFVDANSALQTVLESVPASVRAGFVEAVNGSTSQVAGLDESLWGEGPSRKRVRTAALQTLKDDFVARRKLIDASLSLEEVAEMLGGSEQTVLELVMNGDLVGLADGNDWRVPFWQLNADVEQGFVPGISQLRRVFPGGVISLSRWMVTPNVDLDEMTPAYALAVGRIEEVIATAAVVTAAAW